MSAARPFGCWCDSQKALFRSNTALHFLYHCLDRSWHLLRNSTQLIPCQAALRVLKGKLSWKHLIWPCLKVTVNPRKRKLHTHKAQRKKKSCSQRLFSSPDPGNNSVTHSRSRLFCPNAFSLCFCCALPQTLYFIMFRERMQPDRSMGNLQYLVCWVLGVLLEKKKKEVRKLHLPPCLTSFWPT